MPRLENWAVVGDLYKAPEICVPQLRGKVYGHPRFKDGDGVVTSRIVALDVPGRFAATHNTYYQLGAPEPEWLAWLAETGRKLEDYKLA